MIAVVIDDLAADRQLTSRALRQAGWTVHAARNTVEGMQLVTAHLSLAEVGPQGGIIITDLHMPNDPTNSPTGGSETAGSHFALRLRAQMERGAMPRWPIVGLTALTAREMHLTALAFGCDALLLKPATPDLAERITQALAEAETQPRDMLGGTALLSLLRCRLADALTLDPAPTAAPPLTEHDVTRALLAYRRRGPVGLGESALAQALFPHLPGVLQRGEALYAHLLHQLEQIRHLGVSESLSILQGELLAQAAPTALAAELGLSLSEYYRRRREAMLVMLELLTRA